MHTYIVLGAGKQDLAIAHGHGKRHVARTIAAVVLSLLCSAGSHGQKIETVYLDKKDSTVSCYTVIHPSKLPAKGFLCLVPGFNETADDVFQQTDFPRVSARHGLLTIIPTLATGKTSFGIDSASQRSLKEILQNATSKYRLIGSRIYLGGFSIGGSCVIKYAETAVAEGSAIRPAAVFAIDPPLDFERYYNSCKRGVRLTKQAQPNQEQAYMIKRIEWEMRGTPQTASSNYRALSPYSFSDTSQAAIRNLTATPVRIYTEPDVGWWLANRGTDFSGMNALDGSAMINELNRLGNANAVLITTSEKGFRQPGNKRHPHSWSIVDSNELVKWLLNQK